MCMFVFLCGVGICTHMWVPAEVRDTKSLRVGVNVSYELTMYILGAELRSSARALSMHW